MKTKTTSALFTPFLAIAAACLSVGSAWTADAQSDLFTSVNLNGTLSGAGAIYQYTTAGVPPSTFGPPLAAPRGMAFDSAGNLFVASTAFDNNSGNFQGTIFKFDPNGNPSPFATGFSSNLFLSGLVLDGAGNVFVTTVNPYDSNNTITIYKVTSNGAVITPFVGSPPVTMHSNNGAGLAFDGAGNLFAADNAGQTIYKFTSGGVSSVFAGQGAFVSGEGPVDLTFDALGNLFVSTESISGLGGTDTILKFPPDYPDGTKSTFATGLNYPRGIVFDSVGNLFVAEVPLNNTGNIREFTPTGTELPTFAAGIGDAGNRGPEWLAFPPEPVSPVTPVGSNVMVNMGTVGSATDVTLTYSAVTVAGTTTVTPIDPPPPLPSGFELTGDDPPLAFDITTTATYTTPIIIAFRVSVDPLIFPQLRILHNEGGILVDVTVLDGPFAPNPTGQTIYASVTSLSPFVVAKVPFTAHVQPPINSDGSSVFNANRGVVPVKFILTQDGTATCTLPTATIAVTRTSGVTTGTVDESVYSGSADTGSNFRISSCQYIYNLSASALGVGTYRADIKINGTVVGNAIFQLK
jgi:hypothetical protein